MSYFLASHFEKISDIFFRTLVTCLIRSILNKIEAFYFHAHGPLSKALGKSRNTTTDGRRGLSVVLHELCIAIMFRNEWTVHPPDMSSCNGRRQIRQECWSVGK